MTVEHIVQDALRVSVSNTVAVDQVESDNLTAVQMGSLGNMHKTVGWIFWFIAVFGVWFIFPIKAIKEKLKSMEQKT
jgi:hypothetical protein